MSTALNWSCWLRQRAPLSRGLPWLDALLNSTSIISCLVSVFAYYYYHYHGACLTRGLASEWGGRVALHCGRWGWGEDVLRSADREHTFSVSPERFWPLTFIILILPPSHHNEIEKKQRSAWLKCCKGEEGAFGDLRFLFKTQDSKCAFMVQGWILDCS